jgi:hypothetical protein
MASYILTLDEIHFFGSRMRKMPTMLYLLSLLPFGAPGAESGAADFASTLASTTAQIEEVIVSGKLDSLSQLRKAVDRAENRVYQRYNEINRHSAYDIDCTTEAPLGSRQKVKKCQPRYVSDALHEDAFDALFRNQSSATRLRSVSALAAGKQSFLRKSMLEAAQHDLEMQRAMIEHALLTERYRAVLKQKLDAQRVVWD